MASRGRLADLGDEPVGCLGPPGHDALLGELAHHPDGVGRVPDVDLLVPAPGQQRLEVGGVRGDGVDVPSGEVCRDGPLVVADLLEHVGEGVDRLPPDGHEGTQALRIVHGGESRPATRRGERGSESAAARIYAEKDGRAPNRPRHDKGVVMGIGIGILLLVIGLILLFAINEFPASVQEVVEPITVGWIFVIAGVLALVLGLVMNNQRSRTTHVEERREM